MRTVECLRLHALALAALLASTGQAQVLSTDAPPRLLGEGAYRANAAVARIVVEVATSQLPADGQTPVAVTVRLFGADGQPLAAPAFVTLEASGGRLLLPGARSDELGPRGADADRVVPGTQLRVEAGVARLQLLAPAQPQDVRLRVTAGDQVAEGLVAYVPELRPWLAAGLVEGVLSLHGRTTLQAPRAGDAFEREIRHWAREFNGGKASAAARTAFYLKGTISGDVLLTAAFDSDKDTRARLLRDVRPDEFYPVYGDSALKSFDARSAERLFVRVDQQRSYALYGDFTTGDGFTQTVGQGGVAPLQQRALGNYSRTATGLRAHHEVGGAVINAFALRDSLRQVVEEFASQGSGPYGLRNSAVLEGSEKVEAVTRDRRQPSVILSVRPLTRLVDYSFEPFSGRILLASFLPSVDENLNPVSLRITYEVDQGGPAFWVGGVDAQVPLGAGVEVGGSAVEDRNGLAPYRLLSANAGWQVAPGTRVVAEVAQSRSTVNTSVANGSPALAGLSGELTGRAGRVELQHAAEGRDLRAFVGRSSPLFNNPGAPLQGGRDEAFVQGSQRLTESLSLVGGGLRSEDRRASGGERQRADLGLRWQAAPRLTLEAGLREERERIGTFSPGLATSPFGDTLGLTSSLGSGAAGGAVGFGQQAIDPTTGLPVIGQNGLASGTASSLPVGTRLSSRLVRLGARYQVDERLALGAEVEGDVSGQERRRVSLGADYRIAERTKLYGRWEHQSGWVQLGGASDTGRSGSQFVAGVDSSYWRDTQLFSEYRLRDAISGRDVQLASGARQFWDVAEGVRVNAAVERLGVMSGQAAPARALALGLDYTADPLWRGSTRLEFRRSGDVSATPADERFDTTLWQVMAARKLDRDWTLLARNHWLRTDYRARGDVLQDRAQLGLAYRETDRNRVNALAKVEYKLETDASNPAVGELRSRAWIVSAHADYHPSRPWWLNGRVAAKWQSDRFEAGVTDAFRAQLVAGRLVYDVTEDWDVGVQAFAQFGQRGVRQQGVGVEAGYLVRQNLWLSVGANVSGFDGDRDLVGEDYTRRGAYVRLRFKFDESLFRSSDPETNRSLPR